MLPIISNKKSSKTTNLCDGKRHIMEFDRTPWKIANVKKKNDMTIAINAHCLRFCLNNSG